MAPRLSKQALALLAVFVAAPEAWRYGYDLMKDTGLSAGTLYPLLQRMADAGWLSRHWEEQGVAGRPPRQLYRITASGVEGARAMRQRAIARSWPVGRWAPDGG